MTDNEIIKALKCCSGDGEISFCHKCKIYDSDNCQQILCQNALALINHQKAEIEALQMDNKQLQSDVINANQNWDHIKGLWECEKEKVESAKQKVICACKMLKTAKSEAIKEFAERLKRNCLIDRGYNILQEGDIENLVKEMTEVNEK